MPNADDWVLIFSDGTGQRGVRNDAGVKNTNVFQMFVAVEDKPGFLAFYDPGLGAPDEGSLSWSRKLRNLWSKATGWGITANIVDCYEALVLRWRPGRKIGLFGFSRGAYTARCLGGVLANCGIAMLDGGVPIPTEAGGPGAALRRRIAAEAVAVYKIRDKPRRDQAAREFALQYGAAQVVPDVIGVFDTVKALGLPGVTNVVNPWQHEFHDNELSTRVPVGLHALSIDENRKQFLPVLWSEKADPGAGQVIEQCWFPGVHSDIGGGYDDDPRLADITLKWMLDHMRDLAGLEIPLTVTLDGNLLAKAHDERTGLGALWWPTERTIQARAVDVDALCADIETRFRDHQPRYRPGPLARHPRVTAFYS